MTRFTIGDKSRFGKIKGFTLIELLVVMAILGIISIIALVLISPVERQAQARDAGRISTVTQLGRSLQGYYVGNSGYPDAANWAQVLVDSSEISSFPAGVVYSAYEVIGCTTYVQPAVNPTYCYDQDLVGGNGILVFSRAESNTANSKCTAPAVAYYVFSSSDGRGGTICSQTEPVPWASGSVTYVD